MYIRENKTILTSSHDRGWKPTVKPLNTRGPGFSHGIASSRKTLKHLGIATESGKHECLIINEGSYIETFLLSQHQHAMIDSINRDLTPHFIIMQHKLEIKVLFKRPATRLISDIADASKST